MIYAVVMLDTYRENISRSSRFGYFLDEERKKRMRG
jgi:hypothetical protein